MKRPAGMLPTAWERYKHCADIAMVGRPNIVQTVGDAPASAGFHRADGTFLNEAGETEQYCAAVDFSIHHPQSLSGVQIGRFLLSLFHGDFVPFWRHGGTWEGQEHIHAIWVSCVMKDELLQQIHDFCMGRDGLRGHNPDVFWTSFIHQQAWHMQVARIKRILSEMGDSW